MQAQQQQQQQQQQEFMLDIQGDVSRQALRCRQTLAKGQSMRRAGLTL